MRGKVKRLLKNVEKVQTLAQENPQELQEILELMPSKLRISMYAQYADRKQTMQLLDAWEEQYTINRQEKHKKLHNQLLQAVKRKHNIDRSMIK